MQKYMMATKAFHKLGDLSRDTPSLCVIEREMLTYYVGSWVEGFGFVEVRFPKETTRELTQEEISYWQGKKIGVGNHAAYTLDLGICKCAKGRKCHNCMERDGFYKPLVRQKRRLKWFQWLKNFWLLFVLACFFWVLWAALGNPSAY